MRIMKDVGLFISAVALIAACGGEKPGAEKVPKAHPHGDKTQTHKDPKEVHTTDGTKPDEAKPGVATKDPVAPAKEGDETPEMIELTKPTTFDPAVRKDQLPDGAWICDMGTVHYARPDKGDGHCPICKMSLLEKTASRKVYPRIPDARPKQPTDKMGWDRTPHNSADLAERAQPENWCPLKEVAYDPAKDAKTSMTDFIAEILARANFRQEPWGLLYSMRNMDYYNKRKEVFAEFEKQIDQGGNKLQHLENYAWSLLYMGDHQKIVEFFPERIKDKPKKSLRYAAVTFALAQAHYRIGNYDTSIELTKFCIDHLVDSPNDTRWQLMLSELSAFGFDYFAKYSNDFYTLSHVAAWFPKSDWELPFKDVTTKVAPEFNRWGGYGTIHFNDYDNDGFDDIFYERKWFYSQIFKNEGGKSFKRMPQNRWGVDVTAPSSTADFDNDGNLDIFKPCCNYDGTGPLGLLKGDGNFGFEEVADKAGLAEDRICAMSPSWADLNVDGYVDLLIANWCGPTRVYMNNGDGTFTEKAHAIGIKVPGHPWKKGEVEEFGSHGVAPGYYFGGTAPDLYIQGWGWRRFFKNRGDGTFDDVTETTGVALGKDSKNYWTFSFDHNNDGHMDVLAGSYVVGTGERYGVSSRCICSNLLTENGFSEPEMQGAPTIFENQGDGTFKDIRDKTRFIPLGAMAYTHGDWDNDGDEDVLFGLGGPYYQQAEPFLFYQNEGGGKFVNMTPFLMESLWGKGHGIGFGDYNHDGQIDLVINNGGAMPADTWEGLILENTGKPENHWVMVKLKADVKSGTNSKAIGADVTVKAGELTRRKQPWGGSTFGQNSYTLHFGLGKADKVDEITIRWPNKANQITKLTDVPVDAAIEVDQATGKWRKLY